MTWDAKARLEHALSAESDARPIVEHFAQIASNARMR